MPQIWSEEYLDRLLSDAENRLASDFDLHFTKHALTIESGRSTYSLDVNIKKVLFITWRGRKVDPMQFTEINSLGFNTAVVNETDKIEYSTGEPRFYAVHPTNSGVIRFIPTPNEDFTPDGTEDLYDSTVISEQCIVTCYRFGDSTSEEFALPAYLGRRYTRYYALFKAFSKEGKGQNLVAAKYYKEKMAAQYEILRAINANTYVSRRFQLSGASDYPKIIGRPQLPSNYPGRKV